MTSIPWLSLVTCIFIFWASSCDKKRADANVNHHAPCLDVESIRANITHASVEYQFKNDYGQYCTAYIRNDREVTRLETSIKFSLDTLKSPSSEEQYIFSLLLENGEKIDSTLKISCTFIRTWVFDPVIDQCVEGIEIESLSLEQKNGSVVSYSVNRGSINSKSVDPPIWASENGTLLREDYIRDENDKWKLVTRVRAERF